MPEECGNHTPWKGKENRVGARRRRSRPAERARPYRAVCPPRALRGGHAPGTPETRSYLVTWAGRLASQSDSLIQPNTGGYRLDQARRYRGLQALQIHLVREARRIRHFRSDHRSRDRDFRTRQFTLRRFCRGPQRKAAGVERFQSLSVPATESPGATGYGHARPPGRA